MPSSSIHSVVVFLCCFTTNVEILVSEDVEDIFKSSVHIQDTLKRGNIIVQGVDVNVIKDKITRRKINKYKSDIGHYYSVSMNWPGGIARHPIYVYKAVRDLFVFRHVGKVLLNEDDLARLPTEDDLNGAVNALLRLQVTYDLKTSDIASGIIAGEPSRRLYEDDCYLLGKQAFVNYEYKLSLSWAEMGLKHSKSIMKELHKRFLTLKAYAEFQLGRNQNALETVRSWLKIDKNDEEAKELKYKIKNEPNQKPNLEYRSELVKYHKLCRGVPTEESNTVGVMSKMTCRFYVNGRNPQLILQPAREETINFDPYIVVYRDVISETEMIKLKSAASPKLHTSKVSRFSKDRKEVSGEKSEIRVSKGQFLSPIDMTHGRIVDNIQRRVQAITGLALPSYEDIQDFDIPRAGFGVVTVVLNYQWQPTFVSQVLGLSSQSQPKISMIQQTRPQEDVVPPTCVPQVSGLSSHKLRTLEGECVMKI